ncbi:hypothetical protein GF324_06705 [bacterium]|nr:hypothetical protein [bacterium]
MKRSLLVLPALLLLLPGCVHHRFLVDLRGDEPIRYSAAGDTLDLIDRRIMHPDSAIWTYTGFERDSTSEGIVWTLQWQTNQADTLPHPIAPPERQGYMTDESRHFGIGTRRTWEMRLQGWHVNQHYGNQYEFVPSPDPDLSRRENQQAEAVGLQKSTARRYMLQFQEMLTLWREKEDASFDSSALHEAMSTFRNYLQAHLMTFKHRDPMEVSLEWYPELRRPMIDIASEATGGSEQWFTQAADSIEHRWKTWVDIEDDDITVQLIMPGTWVFAEEDSSAGDTLFWFVAGEDLSGEDIVLRAQAWTPVWWVVILAGVGVGMIVGSVVNRRRHAKQAWEQENDERRVA